MVALLSQCYSDTNMTGSEKVQNELTVKKNEEQVELEPKRQDQGQEQEQRFFPPQRKYPGLPKPNNSNLLKKGDSISNSQLLDLSDYVDYLEKMVVDYKEQYDNRYNKIQSQEYKVIENFSNGNTNDLLLYIVTCIFVLLLVDYIFKMGKNSY